MTATKHGFEFRWGQTIRWSYCVHALHVLQHGRVGARRAEAIALPTRLAKGRTGYTLPTENRPVAFVTCVNVLGVNAACPSLSPGTQAVWRVFDEMGTAIFGFPVNVDLLNATLAFTSAAGLQTTHSPVIPASTFVETAPFDAAETQTLTALTFTATVSQTVVAFPESCCLPDSAGTPRYSTTVWTADSASVAGSATTFPPSLQLVAPGTNVNTLVPVPEQTTLALVGAALAVVGGVAAVQRRNKHNGTRDTISPKYAVLLAGTMNP